MIRKRVCKFRMLNSKYGIYHQNLRVEQPDTYDLRFTDVVRKSFVYVLVK